jgi:hypothetical protein
MFAVIYRGYIWPNMEEQYKKLWRQVATYFIEHRGALGSALHNTAEGEWVAYSRWPNKAMRDASWPQDNAIPQDLPPEIGAAIAALKNCIDTSRPFQETCMDVMDDLLL